MPRTITARENDQNGFKVIGNLRERGKSVDLTGFAVFYEAISPLGMFVRDIAVITNFRDGVFEYTVSKEAVSSSGVWIGYFAFEKGTERFTTQDIRISLGVDVKSGSIQLENYISEFDKIKKQVDALQIAVDKADVVKRSGGTMTGQLGIQMPTSGDNGIAFKNTSGADLHKFIGTKSGAVAWQDKVNNVDILNYSAVNKVLTFIAETNLLKKTGDTMSGNLGLDISGGSKVVRGTTASGSRSGFEFREDGLQLYDWENTRQVMQYIKANNTLKFHSNVNFNKDTDWTPLTLLNGVKQQSSQPASAIKRSGNVVNIVCAITDFKDKQVIANVPAIFRPDREMLFTCDYFQGLVLKTGYVIVKPNGDIYLEGIEAAVSL
ncbi:BppU family phage baseplate upper protein, partial [Bacillus wiedmannii]|uniref:BppU family phage baseplate upper protein n=1 Tax=Bacillus wiedmannii TaxID=1890302 RepID=UPI0015D488E9